LIATKLPVFVVNVCCVPCVNSLEKPSNGKRNVALYVKCPSLLMDGNLTYIICSKCV